MGAMKELMIDIEEELLKESMDEESAEVIVVLRLASKRIAEASLLLQSRKVGLNATNLPVAEAVAHVTASLDNDVHYLRSLSVILSATTGGLNKAAGED